MKSEPILDYELVKDIGEYLKLKNNRDYLLFWFCTYTGLRIQDVLKLRIRDVRDDRGIIKDFITLEEMKTAKSKNLKINNNLKKILKEYVKNKPGYEKLFLSQKGNNDSITRQQADNIIRKAGAHFGIRLSAHSLRKTFARRLYEISKGDITVPMEALNHTTPDQTRKYIGITEAIINSFIHELNFD